MPRRSLTLLLAAALAVVLTVAASVTRVPYVALTPGPTYNTIGTVGSTPVIDIEGRRTYPGSGHLDLTTVSVEPRLTLWQALRGWFDGTRAVVPRDVVYPPGQSDAQVRAGNSAQMVASQDDATLAALKALAIAPTSVVVRSVTPGAPASERLQSGDVVTSVDGRAVTSGEALRAAVSARRPGQPVTLGYTRGSTRGSVTLTTVAARDDASRAVIGVEPQDRFPVDVTINLKDVGGPSAGLMFALGIIDKLQPTDLTGGRYVAGTGEISPDGTVGPIGGIPQKLLGARRKGATVFLTPAANCAEALGAVPAGLQLVRVSTLQDALTGLRAVRDGGRAPSCATS